VRIDKQKLPTILRSSKIRHKNSNIRIFKLLLSKPLIWPGQSFNITIKLDISENSKQRNGIKNYLLAKIITAIKSLKYLKNSYILTIHT
jgi:hypothetical protein